MARISFVVIMLVLGWMHGGWWGVWSMLIISALCLAPFMPQDRGPTLPRTEDWNPDEVVTGAIKGHRDPTRPSPEDFAAMITDNYGKGRK